MRLASVALLALAAACSSEPAAQSNQADALPANATVQSAIAVAPGQTAQAVAPALAIDSEGLRLFGRASGSARPIPFGTPQAAVMTALGFRDPPASTNRLDECGAGPLDQASWSDGLTLYFQDSKFAGWALGGEREAGDGKGAITTASGIGVGSTRAELEAAYKVEVFDSSLGTEFAAGELFGILDGTARQAKITNLWAGTSCNMR